MARISVNPLRTPRRRLAAWFSRRKRLDCGLRDVAVLAAASIGCAWCADFGHWAPAMRHQLLAEKIRAIPDWQDSQVFTELERLVMLYAEVMTVAPALLTDDLAARLRRYLGEAELAELNAVIADQSLRAWIDIAPGPAGRGSRHRYALPAASRG